MQSIYSHWDWLKIFRFTSFFKIYCMNKLSVLTSAVSGVWWWGIVPRANPERRTTSGLPTEPPCEISPPLCPHQGTWLIPVTLRLGPFDLDWHCVLIQMEAYSWLLHGSVECSHLLNLNKGGNKLTANKWLKNTHKTDKEVSTQYISSFNLNIFCIIPVTLAEDS